MKAGNMGRRVIPILLVASLFPMAMAGVGFAQTSSSTCANDSLFLLSPDDVVMEQQTEGRQGLVISWKDLDLDQATCFALTGIEGLDYPVSATGGFGDQVDRQLRFETAYSGPIGSRSAATLLMSWATEGSTVNGVLAGTINFADNGGLLRFNATTGLWEQVNAGLPNSWRQTNMVALDAGSDGFLLAAFSSGETLGSQPRGLYVNRGLAWERIAADIFNGQVNITECRVSPTNNDVFVVGTDTRGLFVTNDGGATFTQWTSNLDPSFTPAPTTVLVSSLAFSNSRLWAFCPNFGLFYSADNGASFQRSVLEVDVDLDDPESGTALPISVNEIAVDPADEDHVLISMDFNGVFQSHDGGQSWDNTYGDLLVVDPDVTGAWVYSADGVLVDPVNADIMVVGMKNKGLYRTSDGGAHWLPVGQDVTQDNLSALTSLDFVASDHSPGAYYCLQDGWAVLHSTDSGVTWTMLDPQPMLPQGTSLVLDPDGSGSFFMASWGGGVFIPGSSISLSDTYNSGTTPELRDLDLGIDLTFGEGDIASGIQFVLKCQTFQGWAIWRAPGSNPDDMILVGLYDRVNPESCIEGYCGNNNWEIIPQCYNSKRAACFNFDTPDTVRFFDSEVYNGFAYYYAVTSYDYGNTALSSPQNNSQIAVYSPRWQGDGLSPYLGTGNRSRILLNEVPTAPEQGDEIYVYPNPLREEEGLPGQEGETVVFTNLPEGARVRIFTTAGDDVINLGPGNLHGGNIFWRTRNRDGERVSAGVYLYKVEMLQREDYWGRVVIIR